MKIRKSVFGSESERRVYKALESRWAERFDLFPSLPFTNIVDITNANVTNEERSFLHKTSVDFTLCEKETNRPILSIDFDGLGHGFSHDGQYIEIWPSWDPYRKLKFDLKLRLTLEVGYPYFVVSYDECEILDKDLAMAVVDGLISRTLSHKRFRELLEERRPELETPLAREDYRKLKEVYEKHTHRDYTWEHYVQDWVVGLEVEADFENDPIFRAATMLEGELARSGNFDSMIVKPLAEPPAPQLKDLFDVEGFKKRIEALSSPETKLGCEVTIKLKSPAKEVSAKVLVRNFGLDSYTIAENIATYLAARKAVVVAATEGKRKDPSDTAKQ